MTPLETFRDHCRDMAANPDTHPADAFLFTQLADEIDAYLDGIGGQADTLW